jgi:hypothetical protein
VFLVAELLGLSCSAQSSASVPSPAPGVSQAVCAAVVTREIALHAAPLYCVSVPGSSSLSPHANAVRGSQVVDERECSDRKWGRQEPIAGWLVGLEGIQWVSPIEARVYRHSRALNGVADSLCNWHAVVRTKGWDVDGVDCNSGRLAFGYNL